MVKTKTTYGQDQDRLGQDQDLKKMVLKPRLVLRPSLLLSGDSCRKSAVMLDRISFGRFLCVSGLSWLLYGLNGAWSWVSLGLSVLV